MAKARFEISPSAAWGLGTWVTGLFTLNFQTQLVVLLDVTAFSGTLPTLDAWLQGSDDGGTTWSSIPCDLSLTTASPETAANVAAVAASRNLTGATGTAISVIRQYTGVYQFFPFDTFRLKLMVGGSATPTVTFSASVVAK